jgi:hypothetical protein
MLLFHEWKMLVIILPGHTTHVLQPMDVGLAGPIKCVFKQKLDQITHPTTLDENGHVVPAPSHGQRERWDIVQ